MFKPLIIVMFTSVFDISFAVALGVLLSALSVSAVFIAHKLASKKLGL